MLGSRLREARVRKHLTQEELSSALDVHVVSVSRWENGERKPRYGMLAKIASFLGVSVAYLMGDEEAEAEASVDVPNVSDIARIQDFVDVPVIDMRACAGLGTSHEFADIEVEKTLMLPAQLVGAIAYDADRRPFGVHVDGDSMSAAGLSDGMIAIVNPCEEPHSGETALVCFGDMHDVAIKRVYYHQDGSIEIRSATPGYPVHCYTREDCEPIGDLSPKFRILGKVMGAWVVPKRG